MKPVDCEDLYCDGRYYDLEHEDFSEDIPFYLAQIERFGEPVLELACGTGRITIPIAQKGIQISGLDISEAMLGRARQKAADQGVDVEWIKADCRTFKLAERFKLIIYPFNSIGHLHDLESIEACFTRVRNHLAEGGRFIIDIFNPRLDILRRDASRRYPVVEYTDPDGKGRVVVTENNVYDRASQINKVKWYYRIGDQGGEMVKSLNMRIFYPQELDSLLHYNGFQIKAKLGDYDGQPFETRSSKQIVVSGLRTINPSPIQA